MGHFSVFRTRAKLNFVGTSHSDEGSQTVKEPEPVANYQKSPRSQLHAYIASHPEPGSSSSSRAHQHVSQSPSSMSGRKGREIEQDREFEHEPSPPSPHQFERALSNSASRRHYRTDYSPSHASPPLDVLPSSGSPHRSPVLPRTLEPKRQRRSQPAPPTPRRLSIDPLPSTHDEFAMHLKGLEVRAEVELDLDEGVSAVGWEESTVEGDEEEVRYEDGVDMDGDRDRSGTARPGWSRRESPYTHSQSRERLYQSALRSHPSPLSRRLPSRSPSPPALPDLPSHSVSGSEEEEEVDTYSSRRARMFSGKRKGKVPMVDGEGEASASASSSKSYSRSLPGRLDEGKDKESTRECRKEDEEMKNDVPEEEFLEEGLEGERVTMEEREQSNYHSPDQHSRTPLSTNHHHTPSPVRLPLHQNRTRTSLTASQTGTITGSTTPSPRQRQPHSLSSSRSLLQSQSQAQTPKLPPSFSSSSSNANPSQKQLATPSQSHSQTIALGPTPRPPGAWNVTPFPRRLQREHESPRHRDQVPSGDRAGRVRFSPLRYETTIHREDYERDDEKGEKGRKEEEGGDVSILTLSLSPRRKSPKSTKSSKSPKSRMSPEGGAKEERMEEDVGDISWTAKLARSVTS